MKHILQNKYYENFEVLHIQMEKAHNYFIPFAEGQNPFKECYKHYLTFEGVDSCFYLCVN